MHSFFLKKKKKKKKFNTLVTLRSRKPSYMKHINLTLKKSEKQLCNLRHNTHNVYYIYYHLMYRHTIYQIRMLIPHN
jgi:hypothetical protein